MATASDARQELHQLVDQLSEEQLREAANVLENLRRASFATLLRDIPGVRMPEEWPPRFTDVEPIPVSGELPSEKLIRERR